MGAKINLIKENRGHMNERSNCGCCTAGALEDSANALWCIVSFSQGGGSDAERTKKKKRGDRYSVQTSLIVAALKKMLPIGLNMCSPADQELINLAKIRYSLVVFNMTLTVSAELCFCLIWSPYLWLLLKRNKSSMLQRDTDEEVREFLQNNLHLQGKV